MNAHIGSRRAGSGRRLFAARRRQVAMLSVGSSVALVLAACGGSSGGGQGGTGQSSTGQSSAANSNQPITIGTSQGLPSIDPDQAATLWERVVRPLMYSSLTHYTQSGGNKVQPDLATKWHASSDLKTYQFTIRSGMKFSNGDPLNGTEVYKTFQRLLHPTGTATLPAELSDVASVSHPSANTITFKLKQPTVSFPVDLSSVFIVDAATLGRTPNPIGSGPYKVVNYVPDDHLTLAPNSNYYGDGPRPKTLTLENTKDNTASVTGLQSGNLDVVWQIPFTNVKSLLNSGGGKFVLANESQSALQWILMTDTSSPPFNNVAARQALSYALDRKTISEAVFGGYGSPAMTGQPVPPSNPAHAKGLPVYNYDLKKASELFAKAGIHKGSTITYWSLNASNEAQVVGQILQQALGQIGITLKLVVNDSATWAAKILPPPKKYPNIISPDGVTGPLPEALGIYWATNQVGSNWSDPAFTKVVNEADRTPNVAKQRAYYAKAQRIFAQQQPAAIVENEAAPLVVKSGVKDAWIDPAGTPHFENAHY